MATHMVWNQNDAFKMLGTILTYKLNEMDQIIINPKKLVRLYSMVFIKEFEVKC